MRILIAMLAAGLTASLGAQAPTLAQQVAEIHAGFAVNINADGPPILFAYIAKQTDLMVRVTIGRAESHLTADGRSIDTTYELRDPAIIYVRPVFTPIHPAAMPALTVTVEGHGAVLIDGYRVSVSRDDTPRFQPDQDCILLLHQVRDGYRLAGGYAGAFEVRSLRQVAPMVNRPGDHLSFAGLDTDTFTLRMVNQLRQAAR
jgi:hypothetical protein